jgi:hypothetical protein
MIDCRHLRNYTWEASIIPPFQESRTMLYRRILSFCVLLLGSSLIANHSLGREWRDAAGALVCEGSYVKLDNGFVQIRTDSTGEARIRLDDLCREDKIYAIIRGGAAKPSAANPIATLPSDKKSLDASFVSQVQPQAASQPAAQAATSAALHKRIVCGSCGQFHLLWDVPNSGVNGTAAYWLGGFHFLSQLEFYMSTTNGFLEFKETLSASGIDKWAFSRTADCCGCISVWYHRNGSWHFFECAHVERPW